MVRNMHSRKEELPLLSEFSITNNHNKKRHLRLSSKMAFLFVSERNLHGEAAAKEVGVCLSSVWWSKTVNIRTESCDVGYFFACHYNNGFITKCDRDYQLIIVKNDALDESIYKALSVTFNREVKTTEAFKNAEDLLLTESRTLVLLYEY